MGIADGKECQTGTAALCFSRTEICIQLRTLHLTATSALLVSHLISPNTRFFSTFRVNALFTPTVRQAHYMEKSIETPVFQGLDLDRYFH